MTPRIRSALLLALAFGVTAAAWGAPPAPGKRGRLTPPAHSVSRRNLARAVQRLEAAKTVHGLHAQTDTVRLVALRVEFPDLALGESPPAELHDRFWFQTQFEFVNQYFADASNGRLDLRVDVADAVAVAAHEQVYYGDFALYDSLMIELTTEAVEQFDGIVDFSSYAGVILLHAGPGQESDIAGDSPTQIWSGYLDAASFEEELSTPDSTILGIPTGDGEYLVRDVIILPEWEVQDLRLSGGARLGHLGVYAHEIGQRLGMIPLFDADPSPIPDSQGIGNFGVMSYGLWVANGFIPVLPSAFNRVLMGWVDPIEVPGDAELLLRDYERGPPDSVVVRVPISAREYFLVSYVLEDPDGPIVRDCRGTGIPQREFRFDDKNDDCSFNFEDTNGDSILSAGDLLDTYAGAEWDFFMTDLIGFDTAGSGYGLLILHVDEQVLREVLTSGSTNVERDPRRKAVDVEEADRIEDLDRFPDNARSFGSAEDYFVRGHIFGPETIPDSHSAGGAPTGIRVELVELPDSTASPVEPSVGLPGARARVRVWRDAAANPAIGPTRGSRREFAGRFGADLVALVLADGRSALVVPGADGEVFLVDADLDEAPVSDGDPGTLLPWLTVPPELRGAWVGPPAVGDMDADGEPEVALIAAADSAETRITRVFAWRRDGTEFADRDGNPATNTGYFASSPGEARALMLFDLDDDAGDEIVVASDGAIGVRIQVHPAPLCAASRRPRSDRHPARGSDSARSSPAWQLAGGPIGMTRRIAGCGDDPEPALAWVEVDSAAGLVGLWSITAGCCSPGPDVEVVIPGAALGGFQMVAGDLDGDGTDTIVIADARGRLYLGEPSAVTNTTSVRLAADLRARAVSPLALADVDADGTLEILVASESAMHVLSLSGAEMFGWPYAFRLEPRLEVEPEPGRGAGSPLVADLDSDGGVEVVLHLPGGALLVWDRLGMRRRDLEAALPAGDVRSPVWADLDDDGVTDLASIGRFERTLEFRADVESLLTEPLTEIAVWTWPRLGRIAWGELGGDGRHAFHTFFERQIRSTANDPALPSFVVAPNPASDVLFARVELTAAARVSCALFNLEGELVHQASRQGVPGEVVEFAFDLRNVASGIYVARMQLSSGGTRQRPVAIRR